MQGAQLETIKNGTEDFITDLDYNKSGVVKRMDYENDTWQTWEFDNRKRIAGISINHTSGEITNLDYTLNGSGDILTINENEYGYDGFDRIVSAKTLIPGQTDLLSLVRASFGTAVGADPIEVEGEIRTYNALADTNSDGAIDGLDHAAACFIGEDDVYDIESFEYDGNGNRTKLMQNGDQYRYTYGERNRLITVNRKKKDETAESLYVAYEYDNCGNTTRRTIYKEEGEEVIVFEYDTMNRLVKTTEDTDVTEYYYDNAGNRFIKVSPAGTTVYLRHGQIAVAMDIELPADTTEELGRVNRYVLSGDLLAGRITTIVPAVGDPVVEKSYYHLDHLNSTKCVTDEDGVVEVMYEYRAFGEQLKRLDASGLETDDSAKYSYGGKELDDDTNLYYFNARYYDATIGRFINVDPVQDGSNWYVYCGNNPMCFVDPTGLEKEDLEQGGRAIALGTSMVELIVGIILIVIPEPATTALGIALTAHGGANTAAAGASTIAYETTDGEVEWSTSAIGLTTQGITYNYMINDGLPKEEAGEKASLFGSAGDLVDGIGSLFIPNPSGPMKVASNISTYLNIAGDVDLAITTMIDVAEDPATKSNSTQQDNKQDEGVQ